MVAWRYGISLLVFNSISPVEHSKRNCMSPRAHVLLSVYVRETEQYNGFVSTFLFHDNLYIINMNVIPNKSYFL